MDFFDLKDISERYIELLNPSTPEKVLRLGIQLSLAEGQRVIDFGCGFGETLAIWGEHFGISGTGIDIRPYACERAREKMARLGLDGRIEIIQGNAATYPLEAQRYDVAACIGATFIWGGYRESIQAMSRAIKSGGKLAIGEIYWLKDRVPPTYAREEKSAHTEYKLLQIAREEGFDLEYIIRSSQDDWDTYESGNWVGLLRWIEGNPDHPERHEVIEFLHRTQAEYLTYGREYIGWMMQVLNPVRY